MSNSSSGGENQNTPDVVQEHGYNFAANGHVVANGHTKPDIVNDQQQHPTYSTESDGQRSTPSVHGFSPQTEGALFVSDPMEKLREYLVSPKIELKSGFSMDERDRTIYYSDTAVDLRAYNNEGEAQLEGRLYGSEEPFVPIEEMISTVHKLEGM